MSEKFDYRDLGLKCGLEIHQQLDSKEKLFCKCPTLIRDTEDSNMEFFRYLRPVVSEMGETDRAAVEQSKLNRKYIYRAYDTTCLVEYDEEPPSQMNREALETSLVIAKMLKMRPVDQVHVMRKIVLDGSNTTGFQRTAFLAGNGRVETSEGDVGVDVLCVEEEASQKITDEGDSVIYSLDRLGIPLVEIGTSPDIISPLHARETAQQIGMLLRSTGSVKRGLGTIRQDVNISIARGARVEIKGVQALDMIDTIVEREVERQVNLLRIRDDLNKRGAKVNEQIFDVTDIFSDTGSKVIKKALKKDNGKVLAVKMQGFGGFIGKEVQPERRFGTEMSDHAKTSGVGGIFHTDELPNYGIVNEEISAMRRIMDADQNDALIMVSDEADRAYSAMEGIVEYAKKVLEGGVAESTRRALPDGNSSYMRPLPGAARMYPETDVPPVEISSDYFDSLEIPELLSEKAKRYSQEYGLNDEMARMIVYSRDLTLFENLASMYKGNQFITPTLIVRTITAIIPELRREGADVEALDEDHLMQLFDLIGEGTIAKEGIGDILRYLSKNPSITAEEAASELGLLGADDEQIQKFIDEVLYSREDFIKEKQMAAVGPLMGVVMKEFRGKVDGKLVSQILKDRIQKRLNENS
ncbi:aspartyl-tRNA(Asn) amidotransferase, B subunit [Methanosalsum zhilinae DSM 4017]|uniref:Glutamyl-tRNA(Gln) amidotransferase subunit E n=1 Tax=Methanosalsum zhilinae (strain DSM 4017 / NBRC 107636 / OCM 62 / WeN5) TaxID=679901 RepID=F7XK58_METZD|nr:Glu-tRNA(Gln) amidotransferase subunit GatE [Methanosalsum zhilinae]AEH60523.1 aspartyl-tRNA(Asn) amidotransferase, B subunit [Methanosalsum zhilinae DSM 4017]